ncbi:MAG: TlpA family protein disulfide reductase, partial [Lewinella sp.]|nr:TlpA family protein disulfide reductase [Lewinella sp.]
MSDLLRRYGWVIVLLLAAGWFIGRYFYFMPKYTNGVDAPVFNATLANGQPFALEDLRGNYVLLDFWGSWCPPCRAQNPALRKLYDDYQSVTFPDGARFNVVSVAIERDSARWQRAIAQDDLHWPYHIMQQTASLHFFDAPIANQYGIRQVPSSYLIDPQGQIIGVNMEPGQ